MTCRACEPELAHVYDLDVENEEQEYATWQLLSHSLANVARENEGDVSGGTNLFKPSQVGFVILLQRQKAGRNLFPLTAPRLWLPILASLLLLHILSLRSDFQPLIFKTIKISGCILNS